MSESQVAGRYAKAMFEIAMERRMTDQIERELKIVKEAMVASKELQLWLANASVDVEDKKSLLATVFAELSEPVQNLLFLLVDRRRSDQLAAIADSYRQRNNQQKGIVEAFVTSAFPLTEEEKRQLITTFEHITKNKIHLHQKVDSDLLGGVTVKIGDRVYDGSLRSKLNRFQKRLQRSKVGRLG